MSAYDGRGRPAPGPWVPGWWDNAMPMRSTGAWGPDLALQVELGVRAFCSLLVENRQLPVGGGRGSAVVAETAGPQPVTPGALSSLVEVSAL